MVLCYREDTDFFLNIILNSTREQNSTKEKLLVPLIYIPLKNEPYGPVVICIPRYGDLRNLHAMEHDIARLTKSSPAASEQNTAILCGRRHLQ